MDKVRLRITGMKLTGENRSTFSTKNPTQVGLWSSWDIRNGAL